MKFNIQAFAVSIACFLFSVIAFGGEPNSPKSPEPPANQAEITNEKLLTPIKLIVLDPGHGGFDSGAVGPGGVFEKDVVLEVAKRLKATIESRIKIRVVLTREQDVFIPLRERAEIANRLGADMFISIHANAAKRSAVGFETFFLSATASDDEARAMALMENHPMQPPPGMYEDLPPEVNSDLEAILFDMAQTEYIKESESLAMIIQDLMSTALDSPNRGVKQAPFAVLMRAAQPAVLVEIGFVSNRKEVKLLTDPQTQDKIAEALAASIEVFVKRRAARLANRP